MRRVSILRTVVITKRKVPRIAKKLAKNLVLSSAVEFIIHHKVPDGGTVVDVTIIESLDACVKILTHL
jgi:hypothetical protein